MANTKAAGEVAFLKVTSPESVLIVSTEKGRRSLAQLLTAEVGAGLQMTAAASSSDARRILLAQDFDLIIINSPLPDELGQDLALLAVQQSASSVLLLIKSDARQQLRPRLEEQGVVVLEKPLNKASFAQAVALVRILQRRLGELAAANRRLRQKLEEQRLVNRAKCLLIANRQLSEPEAHAFIEKQAMNRRETKLTVAEAIIRQYE